MSYLQQDDFIKGLVSFEVWSVLGWHEIRQRYRRSILGPFWITLSSSIMIVALGVVYSTLFGQVLSEYLPFIAIGLVSWNYISTALLDASSVFTSSEGYIKETKLPFTIYACRLAYRNMIIFLHNSVILILVVAFFVKSVSWSLLSIIPALCIYFLTSMASAIVIGIVSTRFRDFSQILASIVQVSFFITPVMWPIGMLQNKQWIAKYNPFYHFIEIIRAPLMGSDIPSKSWVVCILSCFVITLLARALLDRYKRRISYWL